MHNKADIKLKKSKHKNNITIRSNNDNDKITIMTV